MPAFRKHLFLFALLAAALSAGVTARADIYVYVDREGVLHFTNAPSSSKYKLFVKETPVRKRVGSPARYDDLISEASRIHEMPVSLLKAIIKVESDYNPDAVSKAGAIGLMQIMPANVELLGIRDPFDPRENIMGGTRFLKRMIERFEGDLRLALAAYNAGPEKVDRFKSVPPIKETEEYVRKVISLYQAEKSDGT